jgi:hypothetical protein
MEITTFMWFGGGCEAPGTGLGNTHMTVLGNPNLLKIYVSNSRTPCWAGEISSRKLSAGL